MRRPWSAGIIGFVALVVVGCSTEPRVTRLPPPTPLPAPPVATRKVAPDSWKGEGSLWLGTPYLLGGVDRRGIDCSGFVEQVYLKVAGLKLPHSAAEQFAWGKVVNRSQLRAGDLVFFQTIGNSISHVGISLGGDRFIHASTKHGVTISSLRETYYAARYRGARRLLE